MPVPFSRQGSGVGVLVGVLVSVGVLVTVGVSVAGKGVLVLTGALPIDPTRPVIREILNFSTSPSRSEVNRRVGHQLLTKGVIRGWR